LVEVTVNVTNPELDALEDFVVCWNLCDKHNAQTLDKTDEEIYAITLKCKKCEEINRKLRGKCLHLWCKLIDAYLKSTKRGLAPKSFRKKKPAPTR